MNARHWREVETRQGAIGYSLTVPMFDYKPRNRSSRTATTRPWRIDSQARKSGVVALVLETATERERLRELPCELMGAFCTGAANLDNRPSARGHTFGDDAPAKLGRLGP
jgi:hypothetical protein